MMNVLKEFHPLYHLLGMEELNSIMPINISAIGSRLCDGTILWNIYERQIIGTSVVFRGAKDGREELIRFDKGDYLLDNLRNCYEWLFNVKVDGKSRPRRISIVIFHGVSNREYTIMDKYTEKVNNFALF